MQPIGYHASHEQFAPSALVRLAKRAADAGFGAIMCSDHFHPWSEAQGESGFAWSWLGAAMQATNVTFGIVNAPGYRYHPAIIAQASATLAEMYPDRFWLAVGSGENVNEHITGDPWPTHEERNDRLLQCARILRRLWDGETVTHRGTITVDEARLYTRPAAPPPLIGAAITERTAAWVGSWADGLITVSSTPDTVARAISAFRDGGGEHKPVYLQVKLSYAQTYADALDGAHEQWRTVMFPSEVLAELRMPAAFEEAARFVRAEDILSAVHVSADLQQHVEWLRAYAELGVDRIYLHNVHVNQDRFIDDFGAHVLPVFTTADI